MKTRPILFSAPMVCAILEGRKTQTRRIVNPQPFCPKARMCLTDPVKNIWTVSPVYLNPEDCPNGGVAFRQWACPYGQPGDRLRVKEAAWMWCERRPNGLTKTGRPKWHYVPLQSAPVHYCADHPEKPSLHDSHPKHPDTGNLWLWRKKIGRFLPAWASRITLEIAAVRVERLQDISSMDAIDEGVQYDVSKDGGWPVDRYHTLWESINGKGSWDENPWVWVVSFKKL